MGQKNFLVHIDPTSQLLQEASQLRVTRTGSINRQPGFKFLFVLSTDHVTSGKLLYLFICEAGILIVPNPRVTV